MYNQMVLHQLREAELDRLFQAFADSTRRDIVRRVTVEDVAPLVADAVCDALDGRLVVALT